MTVQLNWPTEVVNRLAAEASSRGLSLDAYVYKPSFSRRVLRKRRLSMKPQSAGHAKRLVAAFTSFVKEISLDPS